MILILCVSISLYTQYSYNLFTKNLSLTHCEHFPDNFIMDLTKEWVKQSQTNVEIYGGYAPLSEVIYLCKTSCLTLTSVVLERALVMWFLYIRQ